MESLLALLILFFRSAFIVTWLGYWSPRSRAFKTGERMVPVWFGIGRLLLWNLGRACFVFQENKKLKENAATPREACVPFFRFVGKNACRS